LRLKVEFLLPFITADLMQRELDNVTREYQSAPVCNLHAVGQKTFKRLDFHVSLFLFLRNRVHGKYETESQRRFSSWPKVFIAIVFQHQSGLYTKLF